MQTDRLNVRFFVTDSIQKVKVAYCLTNNMLADFYTKLQKGTPSQRSETQYLIYRLAAKSQSAQECVEQI